MTSPGFVDEVVERLRSCVPDRPAVLHEPDLGTREREYVVECIDSGFVSSVGAFVDRFETALATMTGSAHAVACVNGTAALQVALRVAGVGRGDEVLVPSLTFVATANAVAHLGAVPHLIDVEDRTFGADPDALADHLRSIAVRGADGVVRNRVTDRRIAALVVVHVFGHPARVEELLEVADQVGIPLVEDAAESLGSQWRGRHCGTFGLVSALSFNGNKIVTAGGGGAVLSNDPELAARAKHLTTTAKVPHAWDYVHDEMAYNYRLPNLNAALGLAQVERLSEMLERKRRVAERYRQAFADLPGLSFLDEPNGARSNFWLNALVLDEADRGTLSALLERTQEVGLGTRPVWRPMHRLSMYRDCPSAQLPVSTRAADRLLNLPSSASLAERS